MNKIKFIDLFAGLGGTRLGFEQACNELKIKHECVFTSEIKPYAIDIYKHNFNNEDVHGDITKIDEESIPDFDFLLGGFPCQAFSNAGKRKGFNDIRGTLFFDIVRILKEKNPTGFILENVEGLVNHDKKSKTDVIGNTLEIILKTLNELNYNVSWKVLDSKLFGVPQSRKRIYIVGNKISKITLNFFKTKIKVFGDIQETNLQPLKTDFTKKLLKLFSVDNLKGKAIKDKRGGANNIHSWDLELKGKLTKSQKKILNTLLKERRKKQWAESKGIVWMDGMPLTLNEIYSFYADYDKDNLKEMLDDMVDKKYLRLEHPKDLIKLNDGSTKREYKYSAAKGYNLVTGKLSFELNKILGSDCITPTIVATEASRIGVIDNDYIRRLSIRECFRLFGFPDDYESNIKNNKLYDLIGNTVVIPVVKNVSVKVLNGIF
jgi:DNA (cytosine-5)-methyltransferase 1